MYFLQEYSTAKVQSPHYKEIATIAYIQSSIVLIDNISWREACKIIVEKMFKGFDKPRIYSECVTAYSNSNRQLIRFFI